MSPNEIIDEIEKLFPNAQCELIHHSPFQMMVAVVLSAQTTDAAVNKVTPALFKAYPTCQKMAKANIKEIESYISTLGLYRNKAKSLKELSIGLVNNFNGVVPNTMEELTTLTGVGRKSANVILSECFDIPSIAVDTHVERISKRLKLAYQNDSVYQVEMKLQRKIPKERWSKSHHLMIFFGRYKCKAIKPDCENCPFTSFCTYYKKKK